MRLTRAKSSLWSPQAFLTGFAKGLKWANKGLGGSSKNAGRRRLLESLNARARFDFESRNLRPVSAKSRSVFFTGLGLGRNQVPIVAGLGDRRQATYNPLPALAPIFAAPDLSRCRCRENRE